MQMIYRNADLECIGLATTAGECKAEAKLLEVARGLAVLAAFDTKPAFKRAQLRHPSKFAHPTVRAGFEHLHKFVATTGAVETSGHRTELTGSVVVGHSGVSVGCEGKMDGDRDGSDELNFGVRADGDWSSICLVTSDNAKKAELQYMGRVSNVEVGVHVPYTHGCSSDLPLAGVLRYAFSERTSAKVRASTDGVVAVAAETAFVEPRVRIGAATSWGVADLRRPSAKSAGLFVAFGDPDV